VDLWQGEGPALDSMNGSYGTFIYARAAVRAIEGFAAKLKLRGPAAAPRALFIYQAWQNTHAPLQVPRSYCYNASDAPVGGGGEMLQQPAPDGVGLGSDMSSDCPSEGPHDPNGAKFSWCYCYDNESLALRAEGSAQAQQHAEARAVPSDGADFLPLRLGAHGNFTFSGDNADRHTSEAMARVLDQGMANVTGSLRRVGLWGRTLLIFSSDKCVQYLESAPCLLHRAMCADID
jgi:hypothetical protein